MFQRLLFVLLGLYLISPAPDHVEASSISEVVDDLGSNLDVFPSEDALRPIKKSEQLGVLVPSLDVVVETHDYVVPSCRLAS